MIGKRNRPFGEYADYFEEDNGLARRRPDRDRAAERERGHFANGWLHLLAILAVLGVALGLVRLVGGQFLFEKSLKALVAPAGLVWVFLFLAFWFSLLARRGKLALLLFLAWMLLTAGGNSAVAWWMSNSLQQDFAGFRIEDAPEVPVLLILGGGTSMTPSGLAQGDHAGDRILLAARMAKKGKASLFVCSGAAAISGTRGGNPAHETRELLLQLGVPEEQLVTLGGRNTAEEMELFAQWLRRNDRSDDVPGVLTSAWHMARALRLARQHGLEVVPIPADFISVQPRSSPHLIIPGARMLHINELCLHEYLAQWVNR